MRRRRKIAGRYLSVSVFCFGIHAASVLLEPFAFQLGGMVLRKLAIWPVQYSGSAGLEVSSFSG